MVVLNAREILIVTADDCGCLYKFNKSIFLDFFSFLKLNGIFFSYSTLSSLKCQLNQLRELSKCTFFVSFTLPHTHLSL